MILGARTRLLGVVGFPVEHSFSPAIQGAALTALGLDWSYGAFSVAPEQLADAVRGASALGFVGLNVTLPHKEAALALSSPDGDAARVGAVNTLVFKGGTVPRGLNTDLHGFRMLLAEMAVAPIGMRVALLGAGGAARAVAVALVDDGAEVIVASRSDRRLVVDGLPLPRVAWDAPSFARLLPTVDLLVDATPRGLDPEAPRLDLATLRAHAVVLDLTVRRSTALTDGARSRGLRSATGAAMLLHQAGRALEAWCGRPAPLEVMRAALDRALGTPLKSRG